MTESRTVRVKVSPEVARIVAPGAPRDIKLEAARGALPLSGRDLVSALFFLCHGSDHEIRALALENFRGLTLSKLLPELQNEELPPQLLDLVARLRISEPAVIGPILGHPALSESTILHLAEHAGEAVLPLLADCERCCGNPEVVAAILSNPRISEDVRLRLLPAADLPAAAMVEPAAEVSEGAGEDGEGGEPEADEEEELNLSKYQQALEMGVSEKIKMALTGDKEWRSIFLKDPNKLVSSAVMKNPRITDGEVLAVAKNKSTSDELIRLITLNREWVKHYEVKKALVMHPRTPLQLSIRYMNFLNEKDLKNLAKSRGVSQVIVNNARRMFLALQQRK